MFRPLSPIGPVTCCNIHFETQCPAEWPQAYLRSVVVNEIYRCHQLPHQEDTSSTLTQKSVAQRIRHPISVKPVTTVLHNQRQTPMAALGQSYTYRFGEDSDSHG